MTAVLVALRAARFGVGLVVAVATDLHAMAWKAAHRKLDEILHGAPCPCCKQETDQ